MMRNIYHHRKKLALERLLIHFLSMVSQSFACDPNLAPYVESDLAQLLMRANDFNKSYQKADAIQHKQAFTRANFYLYRNLCDYDVFQLVKKLAENSDDSNITLLAQRIHFRNIPAVIPLTLMQYEKAVHLIARYYKTHPAVRAWQLELLQLPHLSYTGEDAPIWVRFDHGVRAIEEVSMMVASFMDRFETGSFILIDRDIYQDPSITALLQTLLE